MVPSLQKVLITGKPLFFHQAVSVLYVKQQIFPLWTGALSWWKNPGSILEFGRRFWKAYMTLARYYLLFHIAVTVFYVSNIPRCTILLDLKVICYQRLKFYFKTWSTPQSNRYMFRHLSRCYSYVNIEFFGIISVVYSSSLQSAIIFCCMQIFFHINLALRHILAFIKHFTHIYLWMNVRGLFVLPAFSRLKFSFCVPHKKIFKYWYMQFIQNFTVKLFICYFMVTKL